jgi:hypothetical protein
MAKETIIAHKKIKLGDIVIQKGAKVTIENPVIEVAEKKIEVKKETKKKEPVVEDIIDTPEVDE